MDTSTVLGPRRVAVAALLSGAIVFTPPTTTDSVVELVLAFGFGVVILLVVGAVISGAVRRLVPTKAPE